MEKISKFSYLPGIIQLSLVPLFLYLSGKGNYYVLNSFKIFDSFNQHTSIKSLRLEPKTDAQNCSIIDQDIINAYNNIQKKINFRSSFPNANFEINQKDKMILERCYLLSVYELRVNKFDYYNTGAVMDERLLWTTKPTK